MKRCQQRASCETAAPSSTDLWSSLGSDKNNSHSWPTDPTCPLKASRALFQPATTDLMCSYKPALNKPALNKPPLNKPALNKHTRGCVKAERFRSLHLDDVHSDNHIFSRDSGIPGSDSSFWVHQQPAAGSRLCLLQLTDTPATAKPALC